MSLHIGDTIDGKYKIVRLLGEGGMGAVYEGENLRIHRKVAIKVLHANVAQSNDAVQRFEREAQAAGRIGSEHIVEVLDLGELPDGDRYMVMEFLEGESLSDRIEKSGGLSPQKASEIIIGLLEGLQAAHSAGIIHRDLKPDNVFLLSSKGGQTDFVKIVDFGISKFSTLGGEFSMTQTGAVMGTPYYLSPEQAKGERTVDALSDLYAAGVILWESVVGKVPFDGETFNELLFKIVLEPVPDLAAERPDLDPHFVSIVQKAMARERELRFGSAIEMQEALASWLAGQPAAPEILADASAARITRSRLRTHTEAGMDQTATAHSTNGNWANTHVPGTAAHPSARKWAVIGGVAVTAAAAFGMLLSRQNAAEAEAAAAAAEEEAEQQRRLEAAQKAELSRLEAEKAKAEAERARAEQARIEAEKQRAQVQLSAKERAQKEKAEAAAAEEERKRALAAARARRAASPAPAPRPAPRPSPSAPSVSGRTIRTDL